MIEELSRTQTPPETLVPAIELTHLERRYANNAILSDINLTVTQGKIVLLRGSNGAGKTTLLKILATRLLPSKGGGKIFGFDLVKQATEVRKSMAYLSVFGGHYPALTAFENLNLAAKLYNLEFTHAELEGKLEAVGLLNARNKMVREFSSGMKKRLGIAKVILSDAELWLLDEPYTALDEDGQYLIDELLKMAKVDGRTILMTSHDTERSQKFADSVLWLTGGVLKRNSIVDVEVARD
jgi:heme ABC exporter ATP-binding subunit CcmA